MPSQTNQTSEVYQTSEVSNSFRGRIGIVRHKSQVLRRPIRDPGLAYDSISREGPPVVGVAGTITIVAQDEVFVFSQDLRPPGIVALVECIRFLELFAINKNAFPLHLHFLSWQPDDSLDEISPGILGIVEDHDISAFRRVEIVYQLVDDQVLPIV
jgi:hypothetical protein